MGKKSNNNKKIFLEDSITEKIVSFWQNFRVEIILIFISLVIVLVSLVIFIQANNQIEEISFKEDYQNQNSQFPTSKIYIDLSGAVEKPDVYEVTPGARLKDVLVLANGLSAEADRQFFARNFNLARILVDQEKIYVPSRWEVAQGLFQEGSFIVDQINPRVNVSDRDMINHVSTDKININTASAEELDSLPGIGKVTAQKIIDNRPYQSVEELLMKKAVNKSVYEKIKDLVVIN